MKRIVAVSAALLAVAVLAGNGESASAQSDRTLGIECTVAGHEHCGENGPIWGRSYSSRYHHGGYAYGPYAYASNCRVLHQRVEMPSGRMIYRSRRTCS